MNKIKKTPIRKDLEVQSETDFKTTELVGTFKQNGEHKTSRTRMGG